MALLASSIAAGLCAPALASTLTPNSLTRPVLRADGNDTRGPLDLRRMRLDHVGVHTDQLTFTTWNNVTNAALEPHRHGYVGLAIDTNDNPRRYEFLVTVTFQGGHIVGLVRNTSEPQHKVVPAARLGPRTFQVSIPLNDIDSVMNYRFFLFAVSKDRPCSRRHLCVDVMPNRFPLPLQDLEPPNASTSLRCLACVSSDASPDLSFPFPFSVRENGSHGSGLRHWRVQEQVSGATTWATLALGTDPTTGTVPIPGAEGATHIVRVLASDRAGNGTQMLRTVTFPYDDHHPGLVTYAGTWTHATGSATSYLGTTSTSRTDGSTATFTFTGGTEVCPMGMPTVGDEFADLTLDGEPTVSVYDINAMPDRLLIACFNLLGDATTVHTLVLTIDNAPDGFILDGLFVKP